MYNLAAAVFNIECDQNIPFTLPGTYGSESFNNAGLLQKFGPPVRRPGFPTSTTPAAWWSNPARFSLTLLMAAAPLWVATSWLRPGRPFSLPKAANWSAISTSAAGANITLEGGTFTPTPTLLFNGPGTNTMTGGTITLTNTFIANLQLTGGTAVLGPGFQGGTITNLTLNSSISGSNTVAGVLNLMGNITGPLTVLSNATLNLSGNMNSPVTLAPGATLNWTTARLATVSLSWVPSNAVMNVLGPGTVTLVGAVTNAGTINWVGGGLSIYSYYNSGVYNLAGATFNILSNGYDGEYGAFNNAGLVLKYPGAGTTQVYWTFNNTGTVDVRTGSLILDGAIQSSNMPGTYLVEAGASLTLGGGGYLTGEFTAEGGGVMNFTGGTFTNTTTTLLDGVGVYNLNGATYNVLSTTSPPTSRCSPAPSNRGRAFKAAPSPIFPSTA